METDKIKRLYRQGKTVRQIANELGLSRTEVEKTIESGRARRRIVNRVLGWSASALLIAVAVSYAIYTHFLREPTRLEVSTAVLAAADRLPTTKSQAWIFEIEPPDTISEHPRTLEFVQRQTARIQKSLDSHQDIPGVAEERMLFRNILMPSIFSFRAGGSTRTVSTSASGFAPSAVEIVFYPHNALDHPIIGHRLLSYEPNWRALMVASLPFQDDSWFDAIVAHELWHAKRHRENAPSATAQQLSDLWIEEELEAHKLESEVLDHATSGEFQKRINALARERDSSSLDKFQARLRPDDLVKIDALFKPGLPEERDLRAGQYVLSIALVWTKAHYSGEALHQKEIESYRSIVSPQSTGVR